MQGNSAGVFKPHIILTDGHGLDIDRDPGRGKTNASRWIEASMGKLQSCDDLTWLKYSLCNMK